MSFLSKALLRIQPSPTLAISQKATELKSAGKDIISLGAGEPDFDTPDSIKQAAIAAIEAGKTKYTPVPGIPELLDAVCEKFHRDNGLHYERSNICVSSGGKSICYHVLLASLNAGDEVIIPVPYWVSYPDIVTLAGGVPVFVESTMESDFKITPEQLNDAITPNTKWVILNNPSNPSGAVYGKDELKALMEVLRHHRHVWVMSDDLYEYIIYEGKQFATPASVAPFLQERVVTVNGVSKAYAMTGWRIGYCAGPEEIIKAVRKLQSQSITTACSISQWAAVEALRGAQDIVAQRRDVFQQRRDTITRLVNQAAGLSCKQPDGAFYVFVSCAGCLGRSTPSGKKLVTDSDFAAALLEDTGVAVVPGVGFGMESFFRISYATSMENLQEAGKRIQNFCTRLG